MSNLIPSFISQQFKLGNLRGRFNAYSMFIDISGFTNLTEELMKDKTSGSEVLANIILDIFKPLVKKVYDNGGMITNFAGDAFTAVFNEELEYYRVLDTAFFINTYLREQNKKGKFSTKDVNIEIYVKIGISYGEIIWGILGNDATQMYYFRGKGIDGCSNSEQQSKIDEIIFDDNFLSVLDLKDKKNIEFLELATTKNNDLRYYKFVTFVNRDYETKTGKKRISKNIPILKKDISPFIDNSIIELGSNAEFKNVVSVFVSFKEPKNDLDLKQISNLILEESKKYGGYARLNFDDKGFNFLILFGAPKSYENNLDRGLNFILSLRNGQVRNFRAGITYGTVYTGVIGGIERGEFSAIGNIINLSARFMMKAKIGEILVDETIVVKKKENFIFNNLGNFKYKGRSKKISTFSLVRKNESTINFLNDKVLIGRKKELAQLEKFTEPIFIDKSLDKQKTSFAGFIYVYGEAGIGKSRLVLEFKKSLKVKKIAWLSMPCEEILRKSFNPIIYFLKNYFNFSEDYSSSKNKKKFNSIFKVLLSAVKENEEIYSELNRAKSIIGGYIGVGWKNSMYSELDAKNRYQNFLFAVKNLIKAISIINPVIIEIDDVHWIDDDSAKFFKILSRNIDNFPILIICPSRYDDNGNEFKLNIDNGVIVNKINLDFLDKNEIVTYGKNVLETELCFSSKFLDLIVEKTNGNPFFVEQFLLDLKDKDLIKKEYELDKKDGSKIAKLSVNRKTIQSVPSTIQAIIISRIDRLSSDIKEIVQTASVIGRKVLIEILVDVLTGNSNIDKNHQDLLESIENKNIWILLSNINYLFKHAMLRDSAYDMQLRAVLKNKHKLIASSYEKIYNENKENYYSEIAFHYVRSGLKKKALEFLEKAGDLAKNNYENEKALDYYYTILTDYKLSKKKKIEISLKKTEILKLTGKLNVAINILKDLYSLSKEIKDKNLMQKILSQTGSLYYNTGKLEKSMKTFLRQLVICEELEDKKSIAKVLGNIGVIYYSTGNYSEGINYQKRKLNICQSINDEKGIASVCGNLGNIYGDKNNIGLQLSYYKKSLMISKKLNDKLGVSNALNNLGLFYKERGDNSKAMKYYIKRLKMCNELGDKIGLALTYGNIGIISSDEGKYAEAMDYYNKYLELSIDLGNKEGKAIALGNMGNIHKIQGSYSIALECHLKKLKIKEELGDKRGISLTLGNIGNVYDAKKDYNEANNYYDKAIIIDEKLDLIDLLAHHFLDKVACLFSLERYEEANKLYPKVLKKIEEANIVELLLNLKKVGKKIKNKLSEMEKK